MKSPMRDYSLHRTPRVGRRGADRFWRGFEDPDCWAGRDNVEQRPAGERPGLLPSANCCMNAQPNYVVETNCCSASRFRHCWEDLRNYSAIVNSFPAAVVHENL